MFYCRLESRWLELNESTWEKSNLWNQFITIAMTFINRFADIEEISRQGENDESAKWDTKRNKEISNSLQTIHWEDRQIPRSDCYWSLNSHLRLISLIHHFRLAFISLQYQDCLMEIWYHFDIMQIWRFPEPLSPLLHIITFLAVYRNTHLGHILIVFWDFLRRDHAPPRVFTQRGPIPSLCPNESLIQIWSLCYLPVITVHHPAAGDWSLIFFWRRWPSCWDFSINITYV